MTGLVLASQRASRARLLADAGLEFEIRPARVDEDAVKASLLAEGSDARRIADALAELKAVRVSLSLPGTLVLGADQVLVFEDKLVSKSENMAEAAELLRRLRGSRHQLITAAVLAKNGAPIWRQVNMATLWMRPFSDAFLDSYLAQEGDAILGSVGCYRLEGLGVQLFSRIEGDYFSILGLPLLPVLAALRDQDAMAR